MMPVAIQCAGSAEQQARWLPSIAQGECRFAIAATELTTRHEDAGVREQNGQLYGTALMVLDAAGADRILVPVGGAGESLALVDPNAAGLEMAALETIDLTRGFARLELSGTPVDEWLGEQGACAAATARMLDAGRVILAADVLGASERALELAVAYAMQRQQFGRVIGSFQAVKHMCAEMVAELEPARSLVWYAAHAFDEAPEESALMAAHAKAHLGEIGREIVRTATEVHGGIGFTDEQNLHYWFKRVGVDRQLLGSPDQLREQAARLQGWSS